MQPNQEIHPLSQLEIQKFDMSLAENLLINVRLVTLSVRLEPLTVVLSWFSTKQPNSSYKKCPLWMSSNDISKLRHWNTWLVSSEVILTALKKHFSLWWSIDHYGMYLGSQAPSRAVTRLLFSFGLFASAKVCLN